MVTACVAMARFANAVAADRIVVRAAGRPRATRRGGGFVPRVAY